MKKSFVLIVAGIALFAACKEAPKADQAVTDEKKDASAAVGANFAVDTIVSEVGWVGTKPTGRHDGILKLTGGDISVKDGAITGGSFNISISSLQVKDLAAGQGKEKLEGHLLSPDFFDAAKYPSAKFVITGVEKFDSTKAAGQTLLPGATHTISGNLTLKDSTKNVTFPAKVSITADKVTTEANFNINRTDWGMKYGNDQSLGDKFIKPEVNIRLNIAAIPLKVN
jgi:polyisoprenoid-binding protein YceI